MQGRALRCVIIFADQRRFTRPSDLHAPKKIGLGAGKAIEIFRLKVRIGPKNLGIRVKMYGGSSAVGDLALVGQLTGGYAPRVSLRPKSFVPRHPQR